MFQALKRMLRLLQVRPTSVFFFFFFLMSLFFL